MCKGILYVGVDVGQEELWVAIEGDKPRSFRNTLKGIKGLWNWVRRIDSEATLHFCMEATGVYSLKLATCLSAYSDTQVSIVNPAQISFFAKAQLRRSKTDRVDALVILAFAQSQHPESWRPDPESLQQLSGLVNQAEALRATLRQWDNRAYTQAYVPHLPKPVRKTTNALQKAIRRELIKVEEAIQELCEDDPVLRSQIQLLCTIPGVAEQSASRSTSTVRLLACGKKTLTNYSARALVAHAGLAPKHRQSGTSILGKSHLAKEGNKRFRCILYMPTLVGIIHNPILKKFYQRLLTKGNPKMVAIVACMKKLLLMVRAILIKQSPFNPFIQEIA